MRSVRRRAAAAVIAASVAAVTPWAIWAQVAPATQPASSQSSTEPSSRPVTFAFHFVDTPTQTVVEYLSKSGGLTITTVGVSLTGRVTIINENMVTTEKAIELLNVVLKDLGMGAIRQGDVLKIETYDKTKTDNIRVFTGADPDQIPETDEVRTQVVPVSTVDAVRLARELTPLIDVSTTTLAADAGSNSLIITDTAAKIKRIVRIVTSIDKSHSAESDIIVQALHYADSSAAVKLIQDIFAPPTTGQTGPGQTGFNPATLFGRGGRGGFGAAFGGAPGGGAAGGGANGGNDVGDTGKVLASSDTRTNTVVVTGPRATLDVIRDVLKQLDQNPVINQGFFVYDVKNGQAVDMAATLNSLFGGSNSTTGRTGTTNNNTNRGTTGGFGNTGGGGGFGGGGGGRGGGGGGGFGGGGGGRGGGGGGLGGGGGFGSSGVGGNTINRNATGTGTNGAVSAASSSNSAVASLIGQVYVVPDQDTNTLLVATATNLEDQVKEVIDKLDRPVPQVLIQCLIAEVTHDNSSDLGMDFSVLNTHANNANGGQFLSSILGNSAAASSSGGLAIRIAEENLSNTFHALAVEGKLDVLSRPYILATDNQEATVLVGQYVPYIANSTTNTLGNQINTVQYQNVGISLDVTPHINQVGQVVMDVAPQISSFDTSASANGEGVAVAPGVNAPVFDTRQANSRITIDDGSTVVIGGLMQDQKTQTVDKVPILGDLPLLGILFQRNQISKTKTELLIFLTPHVALAPDRLKAMSEQEMKGVKLTPNAVGPGVFQGHINEMSRGSVTTNPSDPLVVPPYDKNADK